MASDLNQIIYKHYNRHSRADLPWRIDVSPYAVTVSEIMLQQTQVQRVVPKFKQFMKVFPDWDTLAEAEFSQVLTCWQGLGYNRRARYLHNMAKQVVESYGGKLPATIKELVEFKGVGINTAGAILVYAFNEPYIFIETNIRSVFIYHLFADGEVIDDKDIIDQIERYLDYDNPREWYWAVMDYGTWLKSKTKNPSRRSAKYSKQTPFMGSQREVRSIVTKYVMTHGPVTINEIIESVSDLRVQAVVEQLAKDKIIRRVDDKFRI